MTVTNDETTGRTGVCRHCGSPIEEGLLLKGFMVRGPNDTRVPSPGIPTWRRLDRGPGSAKCNATADGRHEPMPTAAGTAFHPDTT